MEKDNHEAKVFIIILIIILTVIFLFKGVYLLGGQNVCDNSNGNFIQKEGQIRCVDLENTDICKTEKTKDRYILEHQEEIGNINWSIK